MKAHHQTHQPAHLDPTAELSIRFEREAKTIASLSHFPHIVTLYSIEESDGVRFITMEYVEGKTLGKVIPKHGLYPSKHFSVMPFKLPMQWLLPMKKGWFIVI